MEPQVRNWIEEDVADVFVPMGICSTDVQPIGVGLCNTLNFASKK
jgi:hypothetical protein